jgi:protein-L-isoaspartate(D-aspartate) O-methyltransferase
MLIQRLTAIAALLFLSSGNLLAEPLGEETNMSLKDGQNFNGPYLSAGLDRTQLKSEEVLHAMSRVPRHRFVPEEDKEQAYQDKALPIGSGQTISQPFIVALMSQEAQVGPGSKVLEIGTGSGYQAAVLAELGAEVYSIEIVPELATKAAILLSELNYDKVTVKQGDGWAGWPENAPYDAIIVTASAPKAPLTLIKQLANRGRLIVPIEQADSDVGKEGERLVLFEKNGEDLISRDLGAVRFVPLTGVAREEFERAAKGKPKKKKEGFLEKLFIEEE